MQTLSEGEQLIRAGDLAGEGEGGPVLRVACCNSHIVHLDPQLAAELSCEARAISQTASLKGPISAAQPKKPLNITVDLSIRTALCLKDADFSW